MADLSALMLARDELLLATYREPAVTAYNRLEARPRAHDFTRALRAEVRDPLWMLTRQWQMGELTAEDAGSPIDARLVTRRLGIDRVQLGSGAPQPYVDTVPLEAAIEREDVPFTHALRVQAAQYFLKLHSPALRAKYRPKYLAEFPFAPAAADAFRGQVDGLNLWVATQRTCFDGEQALARIAAGTFMDDVPIEAGDRATVQGYVDAFAAWLDRQYTRPSAAAPAVWNASTLSYPAAVAAPADAGGAQKVLSAPRYEGGRLDWYSFELDAAAAPLALDAPGHVPPAPVVEQKSFLPVTATFKGMPASRFWEMEERRVNFGALDAQTTDHLLLVFAELGLVYGNDWFVVPYTLPVNTLCEVQSLVITDVFGEQLLIGAADEGEENDWQRWSLFNLGNRGGTGRYNRQFLLPATVGATQESAPLERVQYARDETANMVWAIEEVIPDATGRGINGHDAADKTGVLPERIVDSPATIRYLLGTTVPENWIPFLPVQRPGGAQEIAFQRAAMPRLGQPPRDPVTAKGVMLNEPPLPWFINEEEIPYAGTVVTRRYQRVRWYDGRTYVWIGRTRETGLGVGTSTLRFDQIEPV